MYINNLTTASSLKSVTVTLTYEDVRDIANGLYYLNKMAKEKGIPDVEPDQYKEIAAKTSFLFDMVKHGMIQKETIAKFNDAAHDTKSDTENDGLPKYHGQV